MVVQAPRDYSAAPRWSVLLLAVYVIHLCEEWWGGPGFSAWTRTALGAEVSPFRFLVINSVALSFFTAGIIGALRSSRFAWVVVALSALLFLNGALHLLATAAFGTYSPGTVTGTLLYLPLGGFALFSMSHALPRSIFVRAVIVGIVFHALVAMAAFV